jgi:hypothetical protein
MYKATSQIDIIEGKMNRGKSVNGHRFPMPISVEGVIRGLRWGIGPEEGEALSSHHIWMFILSVGKNLGGGTYVHMYICTDGRAEHPYVMR